MMARVILLCVGASGCNEVRMAGVRDEVDGREERGENCSPPHCDGGGVSLVGPRPSSTSTVMFLLRIMNMCIGVFPKLQAVVTRCGWQLAGGTR